MMEGCSRQLSLFGLAGAALFVAMRPQAVVRNTGALEYISPTSLTLRISNGVLVDAALSPEQAATLAGNYHIGDRVQVEFASMPSTFDTASRAYHAQRVASVSAGSGFASDALTSPAWRAAGNLLRAPVDRRPGAPRPAPADDAVIAATRSAVAKYVSNLPDYIVHEKVKRTQFLGLRSNGDTVESELELEGLDVSRSNILYNGTAWGKSFDELPGLDWNADYSTHLLSLFARECGGVFRAEGKANEAGHAVLVYSFTLAPDTCIPAMRVADTRFFPGATGHVYINPDDHMVLRLDEHATHLPNPGFSITSSHNQAHWNYVTVPDGRKQLLETASNLDVTYSNQTSAGVACQYTNYHAFRASTRIIVAGHR